MTKLKDIIDKLEKPALFEKGTHIMWTDPYISEQLQETHLDPDIDLATRKESSIKRTIDWILEQTNSVKSPMSIMELGCGPGLYTERLAALGHNVSGIDFSKRSLQTAQERAKEKNLNIKYLHGSYVDTDLGTGSFDLIYLIYTDICILNPEELDLLLKSVHKALKPGGYFLFDVNDPRRMEQRVGSRGWESQKSGFWTDKPFIALSDSIPYLEDKAILEQHVVLTEDETRVYRFWTRFFDREDLIKLLSPLGFKDMEFSNDVLEKGGLSNGDNILFCKTVK